MIRFAVDNNLKVDEFHSLLVRSGLAERRPVENRSRLQSMLENADLIITARWEGTLVGVARSVTDFVYCCYLSDLAVDRKFQSQGIGERLMNETQKHLHPETNLILLSAPAAVDYYPKKRIQIASGSVHSEGSDENGITLGLLNRARRCVRTSINTVANTIQTRYRSMGKRG